MNYNGRNNYSRKKYSDKHYKNLVIEDKHEVEEKREGRKQRTAAARDKLIKNSGYTEGIQHYVSSRQIQAKRAKRSNTFNLYKKAIAAVAVAVVLITAGIIAFPTNAKAEMVNGWEVVLNGTVLGVTETIEPVTNTLNEIRTDFSENYDMNVYDATTLEYNPVMIDRQFLCPAEVFEQILKDSVDVKVKAWVILVNGAPAAAVKTQEEAQAALDAVLEPFLDVPTTRNRVDVGFVENVEVKQMPIEYSQVTDQESAYQLLRFGGDYEEKYHVVVSGESLYKIGKSYGVTVADLKKANPSLASTSKIYPGDMLLITSPMNRVNVKFVEEVDKTGEVIEYETETIDDDTMLKTETVVIQEGVNGSHDAHALITFINGVETEVEIISESNRVEPVNKIIRKGTQAVPEIIELAIEGDMPIPLKSGTYRISSPFGPRPNIDVPGASKWHKGVDLAANTGTPIYASGDGTVTHSGSGTGYGLYIKISHAGGVETRYAHCSELLVSKGDKVKEGQLIALVGNTGISGGSHLHWEVRVNGVAWDPMGDYGEPAP